jgi:hypothetical protein
LDSVGAMFGHTMEIGPNTIPLDYAALTHSAGCGRHDDRTATDRGVDCVNSLVIASRFRPRGSQILNVGHFTCSAHDSSSLVAMALDGACVQRRRESHRIRA